MPTVLDTAPGSRHSSRHLQVLCTRRKAKWISPTAAPLGLTFVDLLPLLPYLIINSPQWPLGGGASFHHCHPKLWKRKPRVCEADLMVEVTELSPAELVQGLGPEAWV